MRYTQYRFGFSGGITPVVKNLLIINGLFFLAKYAFMAAMKINLEHALGLTYIEGSNFRIYQVITHMFIHADEGHLFSNMLALWLFGPSLEEKWGAKRFLFFYIFTGLGAAFLHQVVTAIEINRMYAALDYFVNNPSNDTLYGVVRKFNFENEQTIYDLLVSKYNENWEGIAGELNYFIVHTVKNSLSFGASGAVFGLLIAFGIYHANTTIQLLFPPIPMKVKYLVGFYAIMELYLGISNNPGDSVAHFAHLGGALFGYILVKYWNKTNRKSFY